MKKEIVCRFFPWPKVKISENKRSQSSYCNRFLEQENQGEMGKSWVRGNHFKTIETKEVGTIHTEELNDNTNIMKDPRILKTQLWLEDLVKWMHKEGEAELTRFFSLVNCQKIQNLWCSLRNSFMVICQLSSRVWALTFCMLDVQC